MGSASSELKAEYDSAIPPANPAASVRAPTPVSLRWLRPGAARHWVAAMTWHAVRRFDITLAGIFVAAGALAFVSCMNRSENISRELLPDFKLTPGDYGWTGRFPGAARFIFGKEVRVQIDTRTVPDEPKVLPPVSTSQAALVRNITPALPAILKRVEEEMAAYNTHEPEFRSFLRDPQVWLSSEHDDGEAWTFVIERTDNPDFGYHAEFKGTNVVEIWAGD